MSCHLCQRLERDALLVDRGLADMREAGRFALTPEERSEVEAEEQLLEILLERIEAQRFAPA